jgi:hypothetical protein
MMLALMQGIPHVDDDLDGDEPLQAAQPIIMATTRGRPSMMIPQATTAPDSQAAPVTASMGNTSWGSCKARRPETALSNSLRPQRSSYVGMNLC